MANYMPNLKDITPDQRFVGMFIGESKHGKTCAACSFPKPVHVLDFDGRIRGAWNQSFLEMDGITYDSFPPNMDGLVEKLNSKLEMFETAAKIGQWLPKTLILDSLTSECFAMIRQALPLTHQKADPKTNQSKKGKWLGPIAMTGPEDYGFEANATYSILSYLRSLPIQNVIVSAHIVPIMGKEDPDNEYSNTIKIGEKLSVRDKIGANVGIYFDHCFRFMKTDDKQSERYWTRFRGQLEATAYKELPYGDVEITGKNFYNEVLMNYVKQPTEDLHVVLAD